VRVSPLAIRGNESPGLMRRQGMRNTFRSIPELTQTGTRLFLPGRSLISTGRERGPRRYQGRWRCHSKGGFSMVPFCSVVAGYRSRRFGRKSKQAAGVVVGGARLKRTPVVWAPPPGSVDRGLALHVRFLGREAHCPARMKGRHRPFVAPLIVNLEPCRPTGRLFKTHPWDGPAEIRRGGALDRGSLCLGGLGRKIIAVNPAVRVGAETRPVFAARKLGVTRPAISGTGESDLAGRARCLEGSFARPDLAPGTWLKAVPFVRRAYRPAAEWCLWAANAGRSPPGPRRKMSHVGPLGTSEETISVPPPACWGHRQNAAPISRERPARTQQ